MRTRPIRRKRKISPEFIANYLKETSVAADKLGTSLETVSKTVKLLKLEKIYNYTDTTKMVYGDLPDYGAPGPVGGEGEMGRLGQGPKGPLSKPVRYWDYP